MKRLLLLSAGALCGLCFGILLYDFGLQYLADQELLKANQHEIVFVNSKDPVEKRTAKIAMNDCLAKSKQYKDRTIYFHPMQY